MLFNRMIIWSVTFLGGAIVSGIRSFRDASSPARFLILIFGALLIVSLLGVLISWKMACPGTDKWINLDCLKRADLFGWPWNR